MNYYSLQKQSPEVDFKTATIAGQAPDKGLYFPRSIPVLKESFIKNINAYSNEAIALEVIRPYIGASIPEHELKRIVAETVNFNIPLVNISPDIASLELFHGPTLAFKDIGARFMSRCLGYFAKDSKDKITVLVATSGDTGGAVADGFAGVEGIEVVILYPSGKVSTVQEKQLTTHGQNIHALEVNGSFDDCQKMVKEAFTDEDLKEKLLLTSANSINVARWLPQQFYYFFLWKQWQNKNEPPVISVPSGNFGNICAGILAQRSGLPVKKFIAACNANDTVPAFFRTGKYEPKKAIATISNAMDVGDPSNFVRILEMFRMQEPALHELVISASVSDAETKQTILNVLEQYGYLLDPHGAVAYTALENYSADHPSEKGVILETADPVKFHDVIEQVTGKPVPVPSAVKEQLKKVKISIRIEAEAEALKAFLLSL
ncbi:MAG: threonine synthase [Ferruginibacter sp.]